MERSESCFRLGSLPGRKSIPRGSLSGFIPSNCLETKNYISMAMREDFVDDVTEFVAERLSMSGITGSSLLATHSDDSRFLTEESREWSLEELQLIRHNSCGAKSIKLFANVLDVVAAKHPPPVSKEAMRRSRESDRSGCKRRSGERPSGSATGPTTRGGPSTGSTETTTPSSGSRSADGNKRGKSPERR